MPFHNKRGFHREILPRFSPTAAFAAAAATTTDDTTGQIVPVAGGAPVPLPQKVPPASTAVNPVATVADTTPPIVKTGPATIASTALPATASTVVLPATTVAQPATFSTIKTVPTVVAPLPLTTSAQKPATTPASASASPTGTASASGGSSSGSLIGGIAGGILAVIGVIGLAVFLLRYMKKRKQNADAFNAAAFKRQSTALVDNTHGLNYGGTRTPLPPSMVERKMTSTPTGFSPYSQHPYGAQQYGQEQYEQSQYNNYPDNRGPPSIHDARRPGQALSVSVPPSPSSSGLMPNPYGQSPMQSPISPSVGGYDSQYNAQGELLQPPQPTATVSRSNSNASEEYDFTSHYVDLDRSSVTPFQAAQYAEISQRLNNGTPNGQLLSVAEGDEIARTPTIADFPAVPAATHFPQPPLQEQQQSKRRSLTPPTSPDGPFSDTQLAPPSPLFSRERITSSPPKLPEIERGSGYNFPVSARNSPRTASFVIPGQDAPGAGNASGRSPITNGNAGAAPASAEHHDGRSEKKRPDSTFTVEDAYGGI